MPRDVGHDRDPPAMLHEFLDEFARDSAASVLALNCTFEARQENAGDCRPPIRWLLDQPNVTL
jgi:hypothetical protein